MMYSLRKILAGIILLPALIVCIPVLFLMTVMAIVTWAWEELDS